MSKKEPIYIIGAGIIGLLAAWYSKRKGYGVVVFDQHMVGKEASWAGGGILFPLHPCHNPHATMQLVAESQQDYPILARDLGRLTGIEVECFETGLLVLDEHCPNLDLNATKFGECREISKIRVAEKGLGYRPSRAAFFPNVAQVRNTRLLKALRSALDQGGVIFRENTPVKAFKRNFDGQLEAIYFGDTEIPSARCLVAAGAWTAGLLKDTGVDLPIRPVRGQMLVIKAPPALLKHIVVKDYQYLIPRRDGRILVGSTLEDVGFDKSTTVEARAELHNFATTMIPQLAEYPIEQQWAGLRPGSPDGIPYIGEHPEISGLYVCAGHHRNGFATGPASARLVVDLMLGREPALDPRPYALTR